MGDQQNYHKYRYDKPRGGDSRQDSRPRPYNRYYRNEQRNDQETRVGANRAEDVFKEIREARKAINRIESSLRERQDSRQYQQYSYPESHSRDYDYESRSKKDSLGKQREVRYELDSTYYDESYASGSRQRRLETTGYSEGSSSRTINWDDVPKGPQNWLKVQEEHSQYMFGESLMITNDWQTPELAQTVPDVFLELEQKFGHKEFCRFHHSESRWTNNSITLGCGAMPRQELAKMMGIDSVNITLVKLSRALDSLCGNLRPGPRQDLRYDDPGHKFDPFFVGIEGRTVSVMDLRSAFLAPIVKILIDRGNDREKGKINPMTPFTDEQFTLIKSGLSAMNQYHIALKGGNIIDTDLCCWIRVNKEGKPDENGLKWKAAQQKLDKSELERRQRDMLLDGMKEWGGIDWKALARGNGYFSAKQADNSFYLFGGEFSLWMQICANAQGGLSQQKNIEVTTAINSRFDKLNLNDHATIRWGIANRSTWQQPSRHKEELREIVNEYSQAYVQCFTRRREGNQTLAEQYTAEFEENFGEFTPGTKEMFRKIGGPPADLAGWITDTIINNAKKTTSDQNISLPDVLFNLRLITIEKKLHLDSLKNIKGGDLEDGEWTEEEKKEESAIEIARKKIGQYFDLLKPKKS